MSGIELGVLEACVAAGMFTHYPALAYLQPTLLRLGSRV